MGIANTLSIGCTTIGHCLCMSSLYKACVQKKIMLHLLQVIQRLTGSLPSLKMCSVIAETDHKNVSLSLAVPYF